MVFGDVLADLFASGLDEVYAERTDVAVLRRVRPDSGLVRSDFYDWTKGAREFLSGDAKITAAVMLIGSNDRQPIREADLTHEPLSDRWKEIYRDRIDALLAAFTERRIPVVWIGNPPMQNARLSADLIAVNELVRQRVERVGGAYVDLWPGFVDVDNRFTATGPDVNGQTVRLRANDGVHFTRAGARKAAHFGELALRRILPEARPSSEIAVAPAAPGAAPELQSAPAPAGGLAPAPQAAAPSTQPIDIERLIDQMARPAMGLEPLIAPPVIRVRPVAGPVLQLTGAPVSQGGQLLGGAQPARPQGEPTLGNERAPPPTGRADDFRWPRRQN